MADTQDNRGVHVDCGSGRLRFWSASRSVGILPTWSWMESIPWGRHWSGVLSRA